MSKNSVFVEGKKYKRREEDKAMKRKDRSGRPIRGNDKCFMENKEFKKLHSSVSLFYVNTFVELRRAFKQIAGDRLRVCATRCRQYSKFADADIDAICTHLRNLGYNGHVLRFVRCTLDNFNDVERCHYKSVCESSAFRGRKKEWRQAVEDIRTTYKQDIKRYVQKLQEEPPVHFTDDMRQQYQETRLRYQAFGAAVQIICELYELLYIRELPNKLSKERYEFIQGTGPVISRYYTEDNDEYKRKPSMTRSRVECLGLTIALKLSLEDLGKSS